MSATLRASIIVIGDEILDGFVRDANAGWLAGRLHTLGIPLDRISVVPDARDAIDEALTAELGRTRPRIVFTSGGVGTTPDDRTMASIADHLDVDLVEDPALRTMVDRIVRRLRDAGDEVDEVQRATLAKLARIPRGARPVVDAGPPSARIDIDGGPGDGGVALIALPGVPRQFRELIGRLEETLLAAFGSPVHTVELTHPYPESVLTPLLDALERRRPDVRIGSYPGRECLLRVQGAHADVEAVVSELRAAIAALADDPAMTRQADRWRESWSSAAERWAESEQPE